MSKGRIIVAVSNDLSTDQRVHKVCMSLMALGYEVLLTGRILPGSAPLERPYKTKRFRLPFTKGALFYAALNCRLFLFLLFSRSDVIHSNDLDTLPACYLASRIRRKKLVYDSHEYFTEVPELADNAFAKKTWESFERSIFPALKHVLTVNESIASIYRTKYKVPVHVLRNLPSLRETERIESSLPAADLQTGKPVIILQGAGINVDRGAEEAVLMMQYLPDLILMIIGAGDVYSDLIELAERSGVKERVRFLPKMPFDQLRCYTRSAAVGLSLDKGTNLNYLYSLPNKLFDYIHSGVPQVVSNMPEVAGIVQRYETGFVTDVNDPRKIAESVQTLLNGREKYAIMKVNCMKAREELCWERESEVLKQFY